MNFLIIKKHRQSKAQIESIKFQSGLSNDTLVEGLSTIIENRWDIDVKIPDLSQDILKLLKTGYLMWFLSDYRLSSSTFFFIVKINSDGIKNFNLDAKSGLTRLPMMAEIIEFISLEISSYNRNDIIENLLDEEI
jgi:hypothetical protein